MPYLTSYLRNVTEETTLDYRRAMWVGNSIWLAAGAATVLFGLVERKLPRRPYLCIGLSLNA